MKKITLCVMAALFVATTGMAQTSQKRVIQLPGSTTTVVKQSNQSPKSVLNRQGSNSMMLRQSLMNQHNNAGLPKAPWQKKNQSSPTTHHPSPGLVGNGIAGGTIISEQPAGEYVSYARSGDAYVYSMFGVLYTTRSGMLGEVVFGNNNEVYIKNIITDQPAGEYSAWLKGKLEGSTITFEMPQKLMDYYTYELYAAPLSFDEENQTFVYDAEQTTFTLDYDAATGTISTPADSKLATGDVVIGMIFGEDESWVGSADWNITFTKVTDEPVVAPEGLTTEQYSLVADQFAGCLVNVGFDGNDVYVQGMYPNIPEAWVKGTISGNKAIFPSGQYLGGDQVNRYHQYLVSGTEEMAYDEYSGGYYLEYALSDNDIVFSYDATNKTLKNSSLFFVNAGTSEVNYAEVFNHAEMAPFTETAATPVAPSIQQLYEGGYSYYNSGYGWGYIYFSTQTKDVFGKFILPEKLSYQLYVRVNGEEKPLTLESDRYLYLNENMTEFPYGYTDNWDIGLQDGAMYVYYYVVGPEAFGVQAIYRGGGEEHRSEITWAEVSDLGADVQPEAATPEYPEMDADNVGGSINYGYFTGNEETKLFGENVPQTYDVAMKIQDPSLAGTHIDNIIIPLQGLESLTNVKVWLSSQLRVEDNQNVPDLISVDVTPEEEGFVSVALPKPYTLTEDGVYVGYSLTVEELTSDDASKPIVTIPGTKPEGLYIHTSKGFLKWLDMSSVMNQTALIQVTVSGKDIVPDAAAPLAGQPTYVKTGEPINMDVTFANHGSNGIKNLDVEYTLNGVTTQQHIDLDEPVEGSFGWTCSAKAALPAITERGNYDLNVKVTKVNGVVNTDAAAEAITPIIALNSVPKHRTLLEEYTGTWCGWCVRGFVGLEKLAELYPDDFVCASFHNGDPMEIMDSNSFPSPVAGFPTAYMDRIAEIDPFYGFNYGVKPMGIVDDLAERAKEFGHANIDLLAEYDADNNAVNVTANLTFPYDAENTAGGDLQSPTFALEYLLVEDELTGEGGDWTQNNYYSGYTSESCPELDPYIEGEAKLEGLKFSDVVVMVSQFGGIEESIPATIKADERITHTYTFDLAYAFNTSGEMIIQDVNKLKVIALLVNTATGEVINANKVALGENTGISFIGDDTNNIRSIEYFDLGGRKLARAQQGVSIMRINYNNGKQKSVKVLRK